MSIYVGNLPFKMTEDDLKQLFSNYGEVTSAKIIIDKMSGRSKGFAFVDMTDDAAAEQAIAETNGKEVMGRPLRVNMARPRE